MPEVIEETERERRLREKEEALLAAQQAAQIQDALTIGPPAMPPEAAQWATPVNTFTGPDLEALRQVNPSAAAQYDAQVAQAQRNSGFINAEVNYEGRVLSPMINPELSPEAAVIAEMRARQFTGQQRYRQGIKDGLTPEESYRGAAFDLHAGNPNAFAKGLRDIGAGRRMSVEPVIRTSGGRQFYQTPTGGWAPLSEKAVKFQAGAIPPDVAHERNLLEKEATELRADLRKGTKRMWNEEQGKNIEVELNPREKAAMQEKIDAFKRNARELTHPGGQLRPEFNSRVDQLGWAGMKDRWENPLRPPTAQTVTAAVPVEETITITTKEQFDRLPSGSVYTGKDGKKYRKP